MAYASIVIPAAIDKVWAIARDFGDLPSWHPLISSSIVEDGRAPDAVGCVRHLVLSDGGSVRERLLQLDDVARSYTYCFVESPFPVRSYVSTLRLQPVTETDQTFAAWWADFDADASDEAELTRSFSTDVFAVGLAALRDRST